VGFALWIDGEIAWARGTHEYRPMGTAVIGISSMFTSRDFACRRRSPPRYDPRFTGYFASLGQMNDFLASFRNRSQAVQKKIKRHKSLVAPYF
jgi:hypothetical protein